MVSEKLCPVATQCHCEGRPVLPLCGSFTLNVASVAAALLVHLQYNNLALVCVLQLPLHPSPIRVCINQSEVR